MNSQEDSEQPSDLERLLGNRSMFEPSAQLRSQILSAVRRELISRISAQGKASDFFKFVAAMAAVLVIGLNVARTAVSDTPFESRAVPASDRSLADAGMLQQLSPDLSAAEATRIAVLCQIHGNLTALPQPDRSTTSDSHLERTLQ